MTQLIASNQLTLTNLKEKAIDRTEISFWHGLSATKRPLGVYDCSNRDHLYGNEFNVTSGKTYTVRVIAKQTKGSLSLKGGIWYTSMTSGNAWDGYENFTLVGEASEDGLGIYERKLVVESGKTKAKLFIQIEQWLDSSDKTAWRIYDGQVFDENGQPLVTDQNNYGALTSPMATPNGTYIWKRTVTYYTDGTSNTIWEYNGVGANGKTGADGRTPYIHWAYADNADGTGLTLTDNGQRYIGNYSDYTQADSTDKTKYTWADRWAKIDSGGRNYFKDSRSREYIITSGTTQDFRTFIYDDFWKNDRRFIKSMVRISLDVTFSPALPRDISTMVHFSASPLYGAPITFKGGTTGRQHFDLVYDLSGASSSYKTDNVFIRFNNSFPLNTKVSIDNANLYISSVREDYRPAVEELDEALDSKADQALTEQQLNLLTEKAQTMQTELDARATMEALSDLERAYNAYVEANNKAVAKSENDLIESARRVDAIVETLGGLKKTKTFIDTYITEANEGIIIGTNNNFSQIRVTHDRIAMYSAGKEVMYISQGVIHIDNGVFTKSLQIGRFVTSQHETNPDINICRYVG